MHLNFNRLKTPIPTQNCYLGPQMNLRNGSEVLWFDNHHGRLPLPWYLVDTSRWEGLCEEGQDRDMGPELGIFACLLAS